MHAPPGRRRLFPGAGAVAVPSLLGSECHGGSLAEIQGSSGMAGFRLPAATRRMPCRAVASPQPSLLQTEGNCPVSGVPKPCRRCAAHGYEALRLPDARATPPGGTGPRIAGHVVTAKWKQARC